MVLPAAPWRRRWWSVVRLMKSACAAGYNNVWHRSTSSLHRKDYLFFFKIFNSLDWLSWESVTEFNIIFSPKHTKKKLLHKSHQLLRNSIFGSQKLLCKILTVNSSLPCQLEASRCAKLIVLSVSASAASVWYAEARPEELSPGIPSFRQLLIGHLNCHLRYWHQVCHMHAGINTFPRHQYMSFLIFFVFLSLQPQVSVPQGLRIIFPFFFIYAMFPDINVCINFGWLF